MACDGEINISLQRDVFLSMNLLRKIAYEGTCTNLRKTGSAERGAFPSEGRVTDVLEGLTPIFVAIVDKVPATYSCHTKNCLVFETFLL